MKKFTPLVPGVFTVGNMICGFISILHSTSGRLVSASWLIVLGAFCDLMDGKIARLTHGTSEIGFQLDSLADFLTFGVAPSLLLFSSGIFSTKNWSFALPIVFLLAGAFRLARFNVTADPHIKRDFQGLPIPFAAMFIATFFLFSYDIWGKIKYVEFFRAVIVLLSWLMISNVRYWGELPSFRMRARWRAIVLAVPIGAVLIKPRWFLFPFVAVYILQGFLREVYWTVLKGKVHSDDEI